MPETLRLALALIFPAGICLLILCAAVIFFGADIPAAKALFSAALVSLAALACLLLRQYRPTPGMWAGVLLLGLFAALHLHMGRLDTAAPELAALAAAGCIWLIARASAKRDGAALLLWRLTLGAGTLIGVWAFIDFTISPRTVFGIERAYAFSRLGAGFLSPNTAATFFGMVSLMGLAELYTQLRKTIARRYPLARSAPGLSLALIATLVPATCLVLTASRGGITFTAIAALLFVVWQSYALTRKGDAGRRSLGLALAGAGGFAAIAGLVWTLSGELASRRLDRLFDDATRTEMFQTYWDAVRLDPVWGHGLGSFAFTNDLVATSLNATSLIRTNAAHNVYLEWLMQAGWAGSLAMWAVIACLLWAVFRGLKARRRQRLHLRAVMAISLLVFLHGLTDYGLEIPGVMWWWAWVLGLGAGIAAGGSNGLKKARKTASGPEWAAWVSRLSFAGVAFALAGWAAWQGQMRLDANTAYRLSPEQIAELAQQEALPPSAYLRDAYGARAVEADVLDLDFAERATRGALDREPRLVSAWNRLVFIDLARHGQLTEAGRHALAQSLHLSPYGDRDIMRWRLEIAALGWAGLDETLRRQSLSQVLVLSGRGAERRWLRDLAERAPADMRAQIEALLAG